MNLGHYYKRIWYCEIDNKFFRLIRNKTKEEARDLVDEYNELTGNRARLRIRT
jgi:hypothetical protein